MCSTWSAFFFQIARKRHLLLPRGPQVVAVGAREGLGARNDFQMAFQTAKEALKKGLLGRVFAQIRTLGPGKNRGRAKRGPKILVYLSIYIYLDAGPGTLSRSKL